MGYEDQREFYTCPLCGAGMGNDIDNAIYGVQEHICPVEEEYKKELTREKSLLIKENKNNG